MAGLEWSLVTVIGVVLLGLALLYGVTRVKSRGKETSPERTERATRELYAEETRLREQGEEGR